MKPKMTSIPVAVGLACLLANLPFLSSRVNGQSNGDRAKSGDRPAARGMPRTSFGKPDLGGIWDFATITPLERPAQFAGKEFLTEAEAKHIEERWTPPEPTYTKTGTYNRWWTDYGTRVVKTRRTSLIVDPPDGKLPGLTPEGRQKLAMRQHARERLESPEALNLAERCLVGFNAGPPLRPGAYNNKVQILQTPDTVAIVTEMIHDARIVPLDGRPPLPASIEQWKGDSRGRWEGDTLVIETRNFPSKPTFTDNRSSDMLRDSNLRLIERFSRLDADTLNYEFTVNDPTMWTRPWTAAFTLAKLPELMFEYACHEGNYAMTNILRGARIAAAESR
jgi:hypothetical protein